MATITPEFLQDRVRFSFCLLTRPGVYKIDDERSQQEIRYDRIPALPPEPAARPDQRLEFPVPAAKRTLVYHLTLNQEHSMGPSEEVVSGPYLRID